MLVFLHVTPGIDLVGRPWPGDSWWGILTLLGVYLAGVGPLRSVLAPGARFPRRSAMLFVTGLALLYFSLENYYLDTVGEKYLFCLHMLQHCIIIFFCAPLLLAGTPGWLIRPVTRLLGVTPLLRFITRPLMAFILFNLVFNVWHLSGLFEWALRDRTVHFAEHATFLLAALLMWWPILSPLPEFPPLGAGGQILYYFAMSVSQVPLFFFLAFAGHVYYDTYSLAPRFCGLTPIEDQQVGGILMKIVGELAFLSGIAVAFVRWYRGERTVLHTTPQPSTN
ncbi:MAG TPA: cytochrome c oxidase assembly protein [Candidatus Xenobia bacterium]|jgi:putative membrane protein